MKKELITLIALGASVWGLSSCESPEEKAKRLAVEELMTLNIAAPQYDAQLVAEAAKGSVKRMQLLLTAGADVNTPDGEGKTALMAAIQSRNPEAVKLLLEAGANLHAKNSSGETALHVAAAGGYGNIVSKLLEKGADVAGTDNQGRTALFFAIQQGHYDTAEQLISANAAKDIVDVNGNNLLMSAAESSNLKLIQLMLNQGLDVNAENNNGETAFHYALNNDDAVKLLLEAGADINKADKQGYTPLMKAVSLCRPEVVKLLLNSKADTAHKSTNGDPIIALAAESGNAEIVQMLIDAGVDTSASFKRNGNSVNALTCAKSDEIRNLLKQTGMVEVISTDKAVALLHRYDIFDCTSEEKVKLSKEFLYEYQLYKDGRKQIKDFDYINYIYRLWEYTDKFLPLECVVAFLEAGAPAESALCYASLYDHASIFKQALAKPGIDVNAETCGVLFGTPLKAAVSEGRTEYVKLLLSAPGIDVNKRGDKGTPLYIAARFNEVEIVKLLLATPGIDINKHKDSFSAETPLGIATEEGNTEVIKLLKAAGAEK